MNELQQSNFHYSAVREEAAEPGMTAQDLLLIIWRHLWIVLLILAASVATAFYLSKHTPRAWRATAQVLLVQRGTILAASPQAASSVPMAESIDTQITLLQSHEVAQEAAQKVGINADLLQGASLITPRKEGDNVIDLAVEADSRQNAIDWANALCQAFVDYKKEVAQRSSKQTLATLRSQADKARQQTEDADHQLLVFQQSHHLNGITISNTPVQTGGVLAAYLAQNTLVENLRNEYATSQAKYQSLEKQRQQVNQAIRTGTGVRDPNEILKLQEQLHEEQQQLEDLKQRYTNLFPGKLAPLEAKIADTQAHLDAAMHNMQNQPDLGVAEALNTAADNAHSETMTASINLQKASQQLAQLRLQTADLPQLSMESDKLTRNATGAHALYESLNAGVRAATIDITTANGNVQVVQWGFAPETPIRPDPRRDLMVGFGVGLALSTLTLLLLVRTDRALRTTAEVRRLVDGPIVAVMPQMTRSQRSRLLRGQSPPQLIEAYNTARANLTLALRSASGSVLDSRQVILVSSSVPGEGKSLTASELAQSFARAGRRVVLVNADMRRPSSLPLLKAGKEVKSGLAEVLMGETSVQEALAPTTLPNLSVLHSGNANRNPMDLISQPQMAQTIRTLREAADVVVIDSPPAAVVGDALLMAPLADCVLFVVGAGMVDQDMVRHTTSALAAGSPKMLAYFVNRAQSAAATGGYSYYYENRNVPLLAQDRRDYSDSRTMKLHPDPGAEAGALPGGNPESPSEQKAAAAPDEAHITGVWYRPPVRVLPEAGTHLVAVEGPYTGEVFALSQEGTQTLGVMPDSDILLAQDRSISRRHAHITPEDGGHVLYDDNSTNGTFVNDVRATRHPLVVGDLVQFGASKFRYE